MKLTYPTQGTCCRLIEVEHDNGIIRGVTFIGGCNGNLQGIAALVKGQPIRTVADTLRGIQCGTKCTSCPDQLAKALDSID